MPPTSDRTKPRRTKHRVTVAQAVPEAEPRTERLHGDSYADVLERDDSLVGTTSSHVALPDRRPEEPSEPALDAPGRLEGSL
jgi:hypothetical protein